MAEDSQQTEEYKKKEFIMHVRNACVILTSNNIPEFETIAMELYSRVVEHTYIPKNKQ